MIAAPCKSFAGEQAPRGARLGPASDRHLVLRGSAPVPIVPCPAGTPVPPSDVSVGVTLDYATGETVGQGTSRRGLGYRNPAHWLCQTQPFDRSIRALRHWPIETGGTSACGLFQYSEVAASYATRCYSLLVKRLSCKEMLNTRDRSPFGHNPGAAPALALVTNCVCHLWSCRMFSSVAECRGKRLLMQA